MVGAVVVGDVPGALAAVEDVVYTVPRQFCAVEAVGEAGVGSRLGKHRHGGAVVLRRAGKVPEGDALDVNAALGALKVVDIGDLALRAARRGKPGDEVGKLGGEAEVGGRLGLNTRQQVHQLGDERHLVLVVQVETPNGVARRLLAEVILLRQRLLIEVHEGAANVEVGGYLIVQVGAQQALGHHAERIVLAAHADGGAAAEYALVDDTHGAHGVIYGVIDILNQRHAARRDCHRPLRHAVSQRNLAAHRAGEIALDVELVLVGILLGEGAGHRVERVEAVLFGKVVVAQYCPEVAAERLYVWEEDAARTGLDGAALVGRAVKPVKHAVGVVIALRTVHAVEAEQFDERNALLRPVGEIAYAHPALAALIQHVQAEVVPPYLGALEEINVLHHQFPQRAAGVYRGALDKFYDKGVGVVHAVGGQLADLIDGGVANHLILVGHGQHLVGAQGLVEGDEA